ncbi:Arrestin (or S-antigen) C-terminal domain-containing protein 1 [Elsinoe fawcettii]|nr:Arrestin (or S-antigen) C-terminal domain-containing protein 1 [Elsinoe fawcettii]
MLSQPNRHKTHLEVIPETKFVVFHGDEHTSPVVKLRGMVRLDAGESMSIKGVKVRLEGKRRVAWFYSGGVSAGEVTDKQTFYTDTKNLGTSGSHKIKAGVIEWPFEFTLEPNMPESVEGFPSTWLVYNLHADVERPSWNQKDLHASTHIRLVRTLGADQMETTRSRTNADIWANKISYSISIPSDAVVFGTSIIAEVDLAPIRKGITLGKVELRLMENVTKRISPAGSNEFRGDRIKQDEIEVAKEEMAFPEHSRILFDNESPDNPMMEDERYSFKAKLPLPKSLRQCRQDVDSHAINITHKFKLMVNIHNPEGHTSQLVCRLPVKLFISPNLPIDDSNQVLSSATNLSEEELNNQEATVNAPPTYGQHQLDELYSDIMPSGYHTTAPSGFATPTAALSRRGSNENLHAAGTSITPDGINGNSINSALLRSRLASLQEGGFTAINTQTQPNSSHSAHSPQYASSHGATSPRPSPLHSYSDRYMNRVTPPTRSPHSSSLPQSRRASDEVIPEVPSSNAYDMEDLTRIPSYGTALRSSGNVTPYTEYPPSYMEATSRPPSPHGPRSPHAVGSIPRSGTDLPIRNNSHDNNAGQLGNRVDSGLGAGSGNNSAPGSGYASATAGLSPILRASGTGFSSPRSDGSATTVGQPLTRVNTGTRVEEGDARLRLLRGRG